MGKITIPAQPEKFGRPYVCPLDAHALQVAQQELKEDPKQRLSQIQALRDWILQQPHMRQRTDDHYLLALLRAAKFSQLKAREMVERGLEAMVEAPEWFRNIDSRDPKLSDMIDKGKTKEVEAVRYEQTLPTPSPSIRPVKTAGTQRVNYPVSSRVENIDNSYCIPLPKKTKQGCQILLYRIGALPADPKKYTFTDTIRSAILTASFTSADEATQIHGHVFVFDFSGATLKHMSNTKLEELKKWHRIWQKNVPGRFKSFHFYNVGSFVEVFVGAVKPFLSQKYKDRFNVHNTAESLMSAVGAEYLPEEYLPDEYAGQGVGALADIIANYKKEVQSDDFRNDILYHTNDYWTIDQKLRPENVQSSFRKLSVH